MSADDLDAATGGIDDRANAEDSRGLAQVGVVRGGEFQWSAGAKGPHRGLGDREENVQRGYGGDPEEDVPLFDLLCGADSAAADDSGEGSDDAGLFELEFGQLEIGLGCGFFGAVACYLGDGLVELVFDVLPVFFAADFFRAHDVGAAQIGFAAFLFGFPFGNLRVERGYAGLLRIAGGAQAAVVEQGKQLTLADVVTDFDGDLCDAAVALGGDVGLLLGDEGAGCGEVLWRRRCRRKRRAQAYWIAAGAGVVGAETLAAWA